MTNQRAQHGVHISNTLAERPQQTAVLAVLLAHSRLLCTNIEAADCKQVTCREPGNREATSCQLACLMYMGVAHPLTVCHVLQVPAG
jgi:hypothetical protein